MLSHFICPDGTKITISECLKCQSPCCVLPIRLHILDNEREWAGYPSVTQLLQGTRLSFLKITQDYALDPRGQTFAILGSGVHKALEYNSATQHMVWGHYGDLLPRIYSEYRLEDKVCTGICDYLEQNPSGDWQLWDYKCWGSYRVKLGLGLSQTGWQDVLDENGKPAVYLRDVFKDGKLAHAKHSPKKKPLYSLDPSQADLHDETLQLNKYRRMLEAEGFTISDMSIQVLTRDYELRTSLERGVDAGTIIIPVKRLEDEFVDNYFQRKANALHKALETGECNECDAIEAWTSDFGVRKRCEKVCAFKSVCYSK